MKNNFKVSLGNKEIETLGAIKMAETMTFINEVICNKDISDDVLDKLSEKHLMECWKDYGNYTNNLLEQHKQVKFDKSLFNEWNMYMNRFFSLYTLIYKMNNNEIKELLYDDMKVQEVLIQFDMKKMKFRDAFSKYEIEIFPNGRFFKCKELR